MIELLFLVLILGVVAYCIGQMPINQPYKGVAFGILVIILIILVARAIGHPVKI